MNEKFKSLIRLDSIRLMKLLEMSYYAVISFLVVLTLGNFVNNSGYMRILFDDELERENIYRLVFDIIVELCFLVIIFYYLKKFLKTIPFIFSFLNRNYKPSLKSESEFGINIVMGIIMFETLGKVKDKIKIANEEFKKKFFN